MRLELAAWIVLAGLAASTAGAEEKKPIEPGPWKFGWTLGVNLSQSAFSTNWRGGDKGAINWVALSDTRAERQFSKTFNLSNDLQLAYGQTSKQITDPGDPDRRVWDSPQKSTDRITFESIGRFTLDKFVDPYVAFRLDSQFNDQSSPIGTLHFNPVTLKETAGIVRVFDKTEKTEFMTRLGVGFRQNLARAFTGSTPDSTRRFSTNDGGLEWQTDMTRPLSGDRLIYKGQLLVFAPVFYTRSGALKDFDTLARGIDPGREKVANFWRLPNVNFQNTFTSKITRVISVNLYAQMVYTKFDPATDVDLTLPADKLIATVDGGIRKAAQWKEVLAVGLSYTLF